LLGFPPIAVFKTVYVPHTKQATNIALVDIYLRQLEGQLIRAYLHEERTPDSIMWVSALAQLWIFGLYELLRTWKQWVSELIIYGEELERLAQRPNGSKARNARIKQQGQKLAKASSLITEDVFIPAALRSLKMILPISMSYAGREMPFSRSSAILRPSA
jgi:hypothetical protein